MNLRYMQHSSLSYTVYHNTSYRCRHSCNFIPFFTRKIPTRFLQASHTCTTELTVAMCRNFSCFVPSKNFTCGHIMYILFSFLQPFTLCVSPQILRFWIRYSQPLQVYHSF